MEVLKSMLTFFYWLKYPITIISIAFIYFLLNVFFWTMYYKHNGLVRATGTRVRLKKRGILFRLFVEFPRQYTHDLVSRPPDFFRHQGLIIYEGRQGSGKTATMVHDTLLIQKEYPKSKVITNLAMVGENDVLNKWQQLIDYKNGIFGVVAVLDELQNWFSSNQSRDFPPEMLGVITQNRKNRRVIFGTAQSFHLLAKPIRSQCIEVRKCLTLFGCLTFVHRKEPLLDSEGNVKEWKNRGIYFYVHDLELRNAYDTWKVIESLKKSGFQENKIAQINNYANVSVINK